MNDGETYEERMQRRFQELQDSAKVDREKKEQLQFYFNWSIGIIILLLLIIWTGVATSGNVIIPDVITFEQCVDGILKLR